MGLATGALGVGDKVKLSAEGRRYVTRHMTDGQTLPDEDTVFSVVNGGIELPVSTSYGNYVWPLLNSEVVFFSKKEFPVKPDRYTKAYVKGQFSKIGLFLYWIGSCNFYLNSKVWQPHFYLWHPATWAVWLATIFIHGYSNIKEINSEMFVKKEHRTHPYSKAK